MIGKLLPILLVLIGTGAGVGAGVFLRPPPPPPEEAADAEHGDQHAGKADKTAAKPAKHDAEDGPTDREYIKLNNQFVVPLVEDGRVSSLVAMSLSVEVKPGAKASIATREPKLRDSFLQVMFDHANVGGFRGSITDISNLDVLRAALREVAIRDGGDDVTDVLILEMARQDY